MAEAIGRPLLPWQRDLADVAGEYDPATGRYVYGTVVASVPRRAGKTIVLLATALHRIEQSDDARAWYTAQTQRAAGDQFLLSWAPLVERSPVASAYRVRRSNGSEAIVRRRARHGRTIDTGRLAVFAPSEHALHGQDADLGMIDEAWWFDLAGGDAILAGLGPTMATRPNPQTWLVSAGGTPGSLWWDRELARAEEHATAGGRSGVCLVDYGAGPDDDGDDPAVWLRSHPAAGFTIDEAFLRAEHTARGRAYFERHYLNRWDRPSTAQAVGLVPPDAWRAGVDVEADIAGAVHVAYDVAPDRSRAAVAAACRLGDRVLVTVVAHRDGTGWVADRVRSLRATRVLADSLTGDYVATVLGRRGRTVDLVSGSDLARACGAFVDLVREHALVHHGQAPLDDALRSASTRTFGDAWAWSRSRSTGDVTPLVAATLAAWSAATRSTARPTVAVART